MGWKVYHFIFVGKSILSFISTWLRFSYTCHKGCLNTWLGDRKLREAKLRCFFKASKTVASPGRWLMWCTAKTLRCSIPSRLTLERPKRLSCDLVIDAIDSATLSPPTIKKPLRVSLQQPCWDKCLSNFNSSCTKPFLGMVLKGENRWRIWLTPFKLGTSATFAAACSAVEPSAATMCEPLRSFWKTDGAHSARDSGPAAWPASDSNQKKRQ